MEAKSGWRAVPASILVAGAALLIYFVARLVITYAVTLEHELSPRFSLVGQGISFANEILFLVGTLELVGRATAATRPMLKLATAGAVILLAANTLRGLVNFTNDASVHRWVYEGYGYAAVAAWVIVALGLTLALPRARRTLGYVVVAATLVLWMPMLLDELFGALHLGSRSLVTVDVVMRMARVVLLVLLFVQVSEGSTTAPQPAQAARSLQLAAKGLWLRVIAVVVVVLVTLLMITRRSGSASASTYTLMLLSQAIVAVLALVLTGVGALNAARAGVRDLDPIALTLGGGMSLWAAGVSLSQLPFVYKSLYDGNGIGSNSMMTAWTEALSLTLPIVVIIGVGVISTAIAGYAASRANEDLRRDAQGKGIGYVALLLVAVALQSWMLPKARTLSAFVILSLLVAVASLWGTILIAKLFDKSALALEQEPGLPHAQVINVGAPP